MFSICSYLSLSSNGGGGDESCEDRARSGEGFASEIARSIYAARLNRTRLGFPLYSLSDGAVIMAEGSTASEILAPAASEAEANADRVIAERGDARAVVVELLTVIAALKRDNEKLAQAASRGFSRSEFLKWP